MLAFDRILPIREGQIKSIESRTAFVHTLIFPRGIRPFAVFAVSSIKVGIPVSNDINSDLLCDRLSNPLRDAIDSAHQVGLFEEDDVAYMDSLMEELGNLEYADSPALICSRLRRELQNHEWEGIESFFEAWNEDSQVPSFDVAQTAVFDAIYDFREGEDLTEDDQEELYGQVWGGVLAGMYITAQEVVAQQDDADIEDEEDAEGFEDESEDEFNDVEAVG